MPSRPRRRRRPPSGEPTATVADARAAMDYWVRRLERLPHRRRRQRREARVMIARWSRRHRDAVVAARAGRPLGRVAMSLGLQFLLEPPPPPGGPVARLRRDRALRAADRAAERRRRSRKRRRSGSL